jgi:hypothetical protein
MLRAVNTENPYRGRDPIQHLACRHADQVQGAAAAWADSSVTIERDICAQQGRRQPGRLRDLANRGLGWHRLFRLGAPYVRVELVDPELKLVWIQPFRAPAVLTATQLLDDQAELLDLAAASLVVCRQVTNKLVK